MRAAAGGAQGQRSGIGLEMNGWSGWMGIGQLRYTDKGYRIQDTDTDTDTEYNTLDRELATQYAISTTQYANSIPRNQINPLGRYAH